MGSWTAKVKTFILQIITVLVVMFCVLGTIQVLNWFTYEPGVECWIKDYRTCFHENPARRIKRFIHETISTL